MGRHTVAAPVKRPGRTFILSIIGAVAVIALVGIRCLPLGRRLVQPAVRVGRSGCTSRAAHGRRRHVDRAGAPDIADDFDATTRAACRPRSRPQDSADTAAVRLGWTLDADAWVPESSVWIDRIAATAAFARADDARASRSRDSVASSPVVFAAPPTRPRRSRASRSPGRGCSAARSRRSCPTPRHPRRASPALLTLCAASRRPTIRGSSPGAMIALGKSIPASTSAAFGALRRRRTHECRHHERGAGRRLQPRRAGRAARRGVPADGTVALDYPFVVPITARAPPTPPMPMRRRNRRRRIRRRRCGRTATRTELLDAFEAAVRDATDALAAAGFRAPDGTGHARHRRARRRGARAAGGARRRSAARDPARLGRADAALAHARRHRRLGLDGGAGRERPATHRHLPAGRDRRDGEVLGRGRAGRVGLLDRPQRRPRLRGPRADRPARRRRRTRSRSPASSSRCRRGSAARPASTTRRSPRCSGCARRYDPEKVNSVLLITDGKNEDENGIDLNTLLAELAKMDDPTKPVPVIMIGFGPDTDLAAMQQIAQATKGAAYSASKPEDLGTCSSMRSRSAAAARTAADDTGDDRRRRARRIAPGPSSPPRDAARCARGAISAPPARPPSCRPACARRTRRRSPRATGSRRPGTRRGCRAACGRLGRWRPSRSRSRCCAVITVTNSAVPAAPATCCTVPTIAEPCE